MDGERGGECLHQLFESTVHESPDAIALELDNKSITYRELNARANRLAGYLQTRGAGPEVYVGLYVPRSIDMIVAMLAILKIGAAYIPLDPNYPRERVQTILTDSQTTLLITETALRDTPDLNIPTTIYLDQDILDYETATVDINVTADHLAYVIYTSGSTGKPKGVQITHRSVVNFLTSMRQEPGLTRDDVMLAATTISFDISVLEIFLPLICGARVRLVDRQTATDGQRLIPRLQGVTVMQATPATWRLLIAAGWQGDPELTILCGGEAMPRALAEQLLRRCKVLWNMYGPTETTVWSTLYRVPPTLSPMDNIIPIGRPIANTQIHILDEQGHPVPEGHSGELCISGQGLARGYLHRKDLTAEKFGNCAWDFAVGRIYRTGDLARLKPDGNLEYLGRSDHQVKVRGYRIELGEIETALINHSAVQSAAVLALEEAFGDKRLVAYVAGASEMTHKDLRLYLQDILPDYMVPGTFVTLDQLPLTPNGKIDRKALPVPADTRPEISDPYCAPQNPTETRLAGLWANVLGVQQIGIHDNFFELGGHSLTATRVISRMREEFDVTVSFQQFFDFPTIAQHARLITSGGDPVELQPPAILGQRHSGRCPLSFAQQRLWYIDQLEGDSTSYNMVEGFRLRGPLCADLLQKAFARIIQRHEILRTTYTEDKGVPWQIISEETPLVIQHVDLTSTPRDEQASALNALAVKEAHWHFDLHKDLLLRVHLIKLAPDDHALMINMQHICSDEWSMGILYDELTAIYGALIRNEEDPLPELSVQYADFARWQRDWLTADVVETKMQYWREQLAGVPTTLDLPVDFARQGRRLATGAHHRFFVDAELRKGLEDLSTRHGVTLFMTLWGAFAALISRYTGQQDLVIATTMANRNHHEIEPLIGFFVNVLPLRVNLRGDPKIAELLGQIRTVALEAFHHQDLPLDKLIEKLRLSRGDLDLLPMSQVAFNFQKGPKNVLALDEVDVQPLTLDTQVSTTELALLMSEDGDGLQAVLEYSTALFRPETILTLAQQYQQILKALVRLTDATLTDVYLAGGFDQTAASDADRDGYFDSYLRRTNLTGNQLLVWLGQKLDPADPIYNSVLTYTLREAIDPKHFRVAFQKTVDCRDSLRTVISEDNGIPQQVVLKELSYAVELLDFSQETDPDAAVRTWISRQSQLPYRFGECLFTCALLKAADEKFIWYMGQHHIVIDGWSQALLYQDVSAFYQQSLAGQLDDRPTRVAFQEYVRHERQMRESARYAKDKAYWEPLLNDKLEPLRFYGKRPDKQTTQVDRVTLNLGSDLSEKIITAARAVNPTSKSLEAAKFNVFLTLYALFIGHISGQREFHIGIPLHNRRAKEFKNVTGLIMQVVPVRVAIAEEDSFQSLLHRISRTVLKAMQHGQYVIRNPDHKPVYDVVLNYHMSKGPNFYQSPALVEWVHPGHAQESLSLQVHDFEQEMQDKDPDIHIDLDFHADVFNADMQQVALNQFLHLIKLYTADTGQPLRGISLLTEEDRNTLVNTINATATAVPETCLHHMIEAQAVRRPEAIAVEDAQRQMTFGQLNARANQLARYLLETGVGPDTPVGLLVERSPEMIVALLAILKSGGCYVPLDPKSPPERLRAIMDDALNVAGVRPIVLTQERLRDNIPEHAGENVALDTDAALWESQPVTNPGGKAGPGHLAYIIYTSGSTGIPKGVMIEHRSIVNYTRHAIKEYEITDKDKVLQFSSITFDAAGEEIYPVLSAGGTLVLRDEEAIRSPQTFIEKCNTHKITLLSMPTTYFHQLTGAVETTPVRFGEHLRAILFGGERVFPQEIQRWQQVYPGKPALINTYGPTEATVVATTYILPADAAGDSTEIPIGKPVANAQIYVLNHDRQPVGVGIPGELCIGGTGLARGYLNRPELTAERFVDNPLRPQSGEKIYRTGDLVRLKPDGLLEFIGRVDDQVKVRGYRIEPGEIETVLKDHPAVGECAVLARKGDHGDHQLEAYIVLKELGSEQPVDMRAFLKDRLPEYMIPAQIYRLESFPVTAQGKINRAVLPDLQRENVGPQTQYVAPTNLIEEQLQRMWQDILEVERVSITDDFFDLGGHSLLATQIISRIQQSFQVELSLRTLFAEPTVKALAAIIATEKEQGPVVPAISRIARDKHRISVNAQGDLLGVKK